MKRQQLMVIALCFSLSPLWAAEGAARKKVERAENPPQVIVTLDHADALYKVGAKAIFSVRIQNQDGTPVQDKMQVHFSLTKDGAAALGEIPMREVGATPESVEYTLTEPGFVLLTAIGRSWQGMMTYVKTFSAAACEPEKLAPAVTMPEDFDAFWAKGRARLAEIPLDFQQEKVDALCTETHDIFKVSFANINDTRIYGYLLIPKSSQAKKYPGFVSIASAGTGKPRESFIDTLMNTISTDEAICLFMGVYDHDLGLSKEYYRNTYKSKDGGPGSATADPEAYFLRRAILGIDRAITWLAAREDVDSSRIVYTGNSQGGGMGLIMTGLNKHITAANVNIPAFCDHLGYQAGRAPGYPGILSNENREKMTPEQVDAIAKILPYFDAVNFARKITVPVILCMGFQDTTCPPGGVYSAYGVISSPKQLVTDPDSGHGISKKMGAAFRPWVREKLGLAKIPAVD